MNAVSRWLAIAGAMQLVTSAPSQAQPSLPVSLGVMSGLTFRGSNTAAGNERTSGLVVGVEGTLDLGRAFLDLQYLQGSLSSGSSSANRDLVEGELLVGYRTTPWLAVKAGLHLRSFVTGGATERWVLWEGRLQGEGELYVPDTQAFSLHSYFEGWMVFSGDASVIDSYDRGLGAEAGLMIRLAQRPIQGRLAYRVDYGKLAAGVREETVETLILAVRLSLKR